MSAEDFQRIAFVGSYVPRRCGIATFTNDLWRAVQGCVGAPECWVLPVNDGGEEYRYPKEARFEVPEQSLDAYRRAADFLNINNVDLVSLQHEFGIYGGVAGSHILTFMDDLRMPIVTTLHTIPRNPKDTQRRILRQVAELSTRVVAMAAKGKEFLIDLYDVPEEKIDLIPHGIHDMPFMDPNFFKDRFGVEGKTVLLTFGLLSRTKGIEHVIQALPAVLKRFPNVVYIVLGATHAFELQREGESYRESLAQLARELGVEQHVLFYNRYVTLEELKEFIGSADIYLTPYLNQDQITSGTLAYTAGAGKAVISSPYFYAQELLAEERGVLVPFADAPALADALLALLEEPARLHAMRKRAYALGREMVWERVGERYWEVFEKAAASASPRIGRRPPGETDLVRQPAQVPALRLDHLDTLTDQTGILHSAAFIIPDFRGGYFTSDHALGLVLATRLHEIGESEFQARRGLASLCLAFLCEALNPKTKTFRSVLSFDRRWRKTKVCEETQGLVLWALGTVIGRGGMDAYRPLAEQLFERVFERIEKVEDQRAASYGLVGLNEYLAAFAGDRQAEGVRDRLARRFIDDHRRAQSDGWCWFHPTHCNGNARLSQALLMTARATGDEEMSNAGLNTLRWLLRQETSEEGVFRPMGREGALERNGSRARARQLPLDVYATVSACLEARRATGDSWWHDQAWRVFEWFFGENDLRVELFDSTTGGCRDYLAPHQASSNEGAEAALAYCLCVTEMRLAENPTALRLPYPSRQLGLSA